MKTIIWRNKIDKSSFGRGPWVNEIDSMQWPDPATGLPCLLKRSVRGYLCGYVGVPPSHPAYGLYYTKAPRWSCHGGVTWSASCIGEPGELNSICHVPDRGEPDKVWWFGFHCANAFDLVPDSRPDYDPVTWEDRSVPRTAGGYDRTYKDVEFVKRQCARLADQISAFAKAADNREKFSSAKRTDHVPNVQRAWNLKSRSPWKRRP